MSVCCSGITFIGLFFFGRYCKKLLDAELAAVQDAEATAANTNADLENQSSTQTSDENPTPAKHTEVEMQSSATVFPVGTTTKYVVWGKGLIFETLEWYNCVDLRSSLLPW